MLNKIAETAFIVSIIAVTASTQSLNIPGWELIWSDEFDGTSLDMTKWTHDIGYHIDNNPNIWGWGNEELQHYTNSIENVFVEDGKLNLKAFRDRRNFPAIDPNRYAQYASGKVITKDKFKFTYGRIDISAKLPRGSGFWPALWMLPNDDVYGGWAASGEIDIMEAKGRLTGESSGAIHFGGQWPDNAFVHGEYRFPAGQRIDTDFHQYGVEWSEDTIKWFVNGNNFFTAASRQWRSSGAPSGNNRAPFDQDFYIIMNLAVGGHFDNYREPAEADLPGIMQIDYVRVYKKSGTTGINGDALSRAASSPKSAAFSGIVNGQINLRLNAGRCTAELHDLKGRLINKINIDAADGVNPTGLRTEGLSKGVYFISVKQNGAAILGHRMVIK